MAASERDPNKVYLSFVRVGDRCRVVDQDGREVAGVMEKRLNCKYGEIVTMSLEVRDAPQNPEDGNAHVGA